MNYYERHIGDYLKDTAHLSLLEHGIYTRLMDVYYTRESAIPEDQVARLIGARSKEDREALSAVLEEFFDHVGGAWSQSRCDREIARYQDKQRKAKASADARWSQTERNANASQTHDARAMRTHSEGNANGMPHAGASQSPVTSNQTPVINTLAPTGACPIEPLANPDPPDSPDGEKPKPPGLPDCPYTVLLQLWAKRLPQLTQPRVWEGNRKVTMRQRWQQAARPSTYSPEGYRTEAEGVAWWDSFFGYIATETKLPYGFGDGKPWRPDLEWVCNAANFQKIIDGKYAR